MSYVVCRAEKLKTAGNVGGSAAHIQRTRPTPNADQARMGLNRVLVGAAGNCPPEALRAALQGAPKVLLCHDGDKAGQRQAQALAAELAAAGVPAERRHPPKPAKDWADALRADPGLAAAARHQAAEGPAESIQHRHR